MSWHDRVIAALMLVAALAVVRGWLVERPWTVAAWAALALGIGAGRLVARRLAFHGFDGLLAADALQPRIRRRYMAAWHGVGLALLAGVTLITRPSLLVVCVPAYCAGALVAGLTGDLEMPRRIAGTTRPGWTFRAWSHRPIAGVVAAMVLLALMLTGVDDTNVRFMTIAGHGLRRIIVHHAKGAVTFLALAVPLCGTMLGPSVAGIIAAVGIAMLLLLTLRVLAYRLHAKPFADFLVAIFASLLMLVAYSMPVALPVIAFAMVWSLQRRGQTKNWLLA